jgi:hypothetical protein
VGGITGPKGREGPPGAYGLQVMNSCRRCNYAGNFIHQK